MAFIIAEWSYRIKLAFHPPEETAQLTNDAQNNSTLIFNSSYSSDLLGEENSYYNGSSTKKSIELQAILQNILSGNLVNLFWERTFLRAPSKLSRNNVYSALALLDCIYCNNRVDKNCKHIFNKE